MYMAIYNMALWAVSPLIRRHLEKRLAAGKEDRRRFSEREGEPSRTRPEGELIWIHAASLGESLSSLPLIKGLLANKSERSILVTTGSVTSANLMEERLPAGAFHQFVPVDKKENVRRFLDYWRPDLAIWIESELWPNLITETSRREIPMMMVNGRMTEKTFHLWRKSGGFGKKLISKFDYCHCQNVETEARLNFLGARDVACLGNLKYSADPLPLQKDPYRRMLRAVRNRKAWLAASTHPGEEAYIVEAHRTLKQIIPDLLTIIVPRHPERGDDIVGKVKMAGLSVVQRSKGQFPDINDEIYIADTIGELGLFYNLLDVVFVGGSLVPKGGQNLLEPARMHCAIVHGPHMDNFLDVAADLHAGDAAITVRNVAELTKAIGGLLASTGRRVEMAGNGLFVIRSGDRILDTVLAKIEELLSEGKK